MCRESQPTTAASFAGAPLRRPDSRESDDDADNGGSSGDISGKLSSPQQPLDKEGHASRYTPVQDDSAADPPQKPQKPREQDSDASRYTSVQVDSSTVDRSLWSLGPAPAPFDLWGAVWGLGKEITGGFVPGAPSPAPPPQKEEVPPPAPAPAPVPFDLPMVTRPLVQTPQLPINSVDDFSGLTEKQLFDIFTQGVADIPSDLPGERGVHRYYLKAEVSRVLDW